MHPHTGLLASLMDHLQGLWLFRKLRRKQRAVALFASARISRNNPHPRYTKLAEELGERLAQEGYTLICGGGPGLMEASCRGVKRAGGTSYGINVLLPYEQFPNPELTYQMTARTLAVRKQLMLRHASAAIILPGGYGTLDELLETLTAVLVKHQRHMPVVLVDRAFWQGFMDWLRSGPPYHEGALGAHELDFVVFADNTDEILKALHA